MTEKHDTAIPVEMDHDELVLAMGAALRAVSIRLIACVGATEAQNAMFAEGLSIATGLLTSSEIAILLRGMADRIDSGELENTSH